MKTKYPYAILESTPLKFYKFVNVTLAIGLVFRIFSILAVFAGFVSDFEHWYNLLFSAAGLILAFYALLGLSGMKWYGPLCYLSIFAITWLDALATSALAIYYGLTNADYSSFYGRVIVLPLIMIPVWIYFRKRRLLFSPPPADAPDSFQPAESVPVFVAEPPLSTQIGPTQSPFPAEIPNNAPVVAPTPDNASSERMPDPATISEASPVVENTESISLSESSQRFVPPADYPVADSRPTVQFCRKCGARLLPESAFCSYCGTQVIHGGS